MCDTGHTWKLTSETLMLEELRSSHDKKCPKLDREGVCCYIMRIIRAFGALGGEL